MKKALTFLCMLYLSSPTLFSQDKHDHIWVIGTEIISAPHRSGGNLIDFNSGKADTSSLKIPINLDVSMGAICNEGGNLMFYTNGCEIANYAHRHVQR
ncbi:MAG: hypothetical protein IPJ82_11625 [Lewinellaceae bacterium]|nr:hypothetical protein [Lewinellaceae bacterium]